MLALQRMLREITELSATVADLNREIRDVESDVGIANDLRDQRQRVVRDRRAGRDPHAQRLGWERDRADDERLHLVSGRRSGSLTARANPNNNGSFDHLHRRRRHQAG